MFKKKFRGLKCMYVFVRGSDLGLAQSPLYGQNFTIDYEIILESPKFSFLDRTEYKCGVHYANVTGVVHPKLKIII